VADAEDISAPEGFDRLYDQQIGPHVAGLEETRLACRKSFFWRLLTVAVLLLLIFVGFRTLTSFSFEITLLAAFLVVVGAFFWLRNAFRKFDEAARELIMPSVCGLIGEVDYERRPSGYQTLHLFEYVGAVPGFSRSSLEDLFTGRHRDTDYAMVEAKLRTRGRRSRTVFKGLLLTVSVPQAFKAKVLIGREAGELLNKLDSWFKKLSDMKPVQFQHRDFETTFEVYSDDPDEARELLNPGFLDSMLAIAKGHEGRVRAAFVDGWFLLSLESRKSFFEPVSLFRKTDDLKDRIRSLVDEMLIAHRLIDILHGERPRRLT